MIEGLNELLDDTSQTGLTELRAMLLEILGGSEAAGRLTRQQDLSPRAARVYRLQFEIDGLARSFVVKRLRPDIAHRNYLVIKRWLPAVDLADHGPILLGVAAERNSQCVWHVYEDHGDWALDPNQPNPAAVQAAVEVIAKLHTRFAGHPLLPECRLHGGDLGAGFFSANVRDAIQCLSALQPPDVELSPNHASLRDRLLEQIHRLLDEQTQRSATLLEIGGPETLVHGDLWPTNTFVLPTTHGLEARLIDWDHAAVGSASYDLSTLLLRYPCRHRLWILELYREAVARRGWRLPPAEDLNLLFGTHEYARLANRIIWPAIALVKDHADWGFEELAEVERWFINFQPVFSGARGSSLSKVERQ